MSEPFELTKELKALPSGKEMNLGRVRPHGSLYARKDTTGAVAFTWRVFHKGENIRERIGLFDPKADPRTVTATANGHSVESARRAAEECAKTHNNFIDHGGYSEAVKNAPIADDGASYTLSDLCDVYVEAQKAEGRSSATHAEGIFRLHIKEAHPKLAEKPARDILATDIADMMRTLIEKGKGTTANQMRAYLGSAYEKALTAKTVPSVPKKFIGFGVVVNPTKGTKKDPRYQRADKNPLSLDEMRLYWQIIKDAPGLRGALLRVHLLTGGQRIRQLARLETKEINREYFVIWDGKGRPPAPARMHMVPLIPEARAALAACNPTGTYAFCSEGDGKVAIAPTTVSDWARLTAGGLIKDFTLKRVRSGVETLLSMHGVNKEIRGHLLSHGRGGVQESSYDANDFFKEKKEALEVLLRVLNEKPAAA